MSNLRCPGKRILIIEPNSNRMEIHAQVRDTTMSNAEPVINQRSFWVVLGHQSHKVRPTTTLICWSTFSVSTPTWRGVSLSQPPTLMMLVYCNDYLLHTSRSWVFVSAIIVMLCLPLVLTLCLCRVILTYRNKWCKSHQSILDASNFSSCVVTDGVCACFAYRGMIAIV